jgi:signal transduction histidine kinase
MDEMTRRAADWSAHSLTERFGADQRFQEMQSLAGTLDGVLDRLAAVLRHERGLSSELSHELRTPLSSIMAETDLLLARAHSAAENETAYRGIRESAVAMNDILQTLLASARFEMQQAPGRCALRPVVDAALRAHRTTARRSAPPTIHVDGADSIDVGVDGAVVERILAPLLDNARRYATDEVWIGAHRASDSVLVEIRDDGPGVPAGMAELIFEPGQRASYHDRHDGAGLGLALARRLARTAGGDITCTGGSTFRVRFPPA